MKKHIFTRLSFLAVAVVATVALLLAVACSSGQTAEVAATEAPSPAAVTPAPSREPEVVSVLLEAEETPTPEPLATPEPTPYDITGNGVVDEVDAYLFSLWQDGTVETLEELDGLKVYFENSLCGEKFYDKFCYTGEESGDGYYRNGYVSYTLTYADEPMGNRTTRYYLVDIYVRDITCLKTYIATNPEATGKLKKYLADDPVNMAKEANALIAITGDYSSARSVGLMVRNGVWYRSTIDNDRDIGVLKKDGTLVTIDRRTFTLSDIEAMDPWQVWSFGPGLLTDDGQTKETFHSDVNNFNPRSAFGYYEPGHYCFFMGEARGTEEKAHNSLGFTLKQLSQFFYDLGCKAAYNFDGGATAAMMTPDGMISERWQDRDSSDILYLAQGPDTAETVSDETEDSAEATAEEEAGTDTGAAEENTASADTAVDDETTPEDVGEN